MKSHFISAATVKPEDARALRFLHDLTGGAEMGVGEFNSDIPDVPTGKVYGIKCFDAAEAAAILNEVIPDGRQPFFADDGFVFVNTGDLACYEPELVANKTRLRREIDGLMPPPERPNLRIVK